MCGSGKRCGVLLCIVLFFLRLLQSRAAFLSIDCGAVSSYDDSLGLNWVTDEGYTTHGENAVVDITGAKTGGDAKQNGPKLQTLRYFPEPILRQCYFVPVKAGTGTMFRFMFYGGNFTSGLHGTTEFYVGLGNHFTTIVQIDDPLQPIMREIAIVPLTNPYPVCFFRSGDPLNHPFVSSIEVRELLPGSYVLGFKKFVMQNIFTTDCGRKKGSPSVRYPDDEVDRIWTADPPEFDIPSITNLKAKFVNNDSEFVNNGASIVLPVMKSAWSAPRISFLMEIPKNVTALYYQLTFVEITQVKPTDIREIDAYIDGVPLYQAPYRVNGSTLTVWNISEPHQVDDQGSQAVNITILPTADSTLGAILNAVEIWAITQFDHTLATFQDDVMALDIVKLEFNLAQYEGDPCLPIPYPWLACSEPSNSTKITKLNLTSRNISSTITPTIASLSDLEELNLEKNNITGTIPDLSALTKLQALRLQSNRLEGPIPSFLGDLPYLTLINLDHNLLEGKLPASLEQKLSTGSIIFSALGNPYLCFGGNPCLPSPNDATSTALGAKKKDGSKVGIAIGAAVGSVVLLALAAALIYILRMQKDRKLDTPFYRHTCNIDSNTGSSFTWAQVLAATDNFSKILGKGGFGDVYFGKLPDGREVAVKVNKENTSQGSEQFLNEVSLLSRVHHRNLVSLVGHCSEGNHQVLIYMFMSQGTLEENLHGAAPPRSRLPWETRLKIVLDSGRGLEYLHSSCNPPIIHRDIKSANILLNDKLDAKISDFGISKVTHEDKPGWVTTMIKGTFGYLDPEYFLEQRLTQKSDVYSFGVVLLEVITGMPPKSNNFPNSRTSNVLEWVRSHVRDGDIESVIDPLMDGGYNAESVWKVTEIALACLRDKGVDRPDMQQVNHVLSEADELQCQSSAAVSAAPFTDLGDGAYRHRDRSTASSQESFATYSTYNITAR